MQIFNRSKKIKEAAASTLMHFIGGYEDYGYEETFDKYTYGEIGNLIWSLIQALLSRNTKVQECATKSLRFMYSAFQTLGGVKSYYTSYSDRVPFEHFLLMIVDEFYYQLAMSAIHGRETKYSKRSKGLKDFIKAKRVQKQTDKENFMPDGDNFVKLSDSPPKSREALKSEMMRLYAQSGQLDEKIKGLDQK